jgi:hypothetical protein
MPGVTDAAGVRALTFGSGYFRDPRQDGAFTYVGPFDLPDLHRRPGDIPDVDPAERDRLVLLAETWDAALAAETTGDYRRLESFARLEPIGVVTVWPDVAPHIYEVGVGDPAQLLPRCAMGAVLGSVRDGLQRWCTLGFAAGGGFELTPGSFVGVAYAAFAFELSAGPRRGPVCAICGTPLEGRRITKTYCGDRCKARARRARERAATTHDLAGEAAVLAAQLGASDSATIYVEVAGLDAAGAEAMLTADPPLHVEWDHVRQKWAVRNATADEAAEAQASADEVATKIRNTRRVLREPSPEILRPEDLAPDA